eukprot:350792-Chlamydomonas_euryale.AAC.10
MDGGGGRGPALRGFTRHAADAALLGSSTPSRALACRTSSAAEETYGFLKTRTRVGATAPPPPHTCNWDPFRSPFRSPCWMHPTAAPVVGPLSLWANGMRAYMLPAARAFLHPCERHRKLCHAWRSARAQRAAERGTSSLQRGRAPTDLSRVHTLSPTREGQAQCLVHA